MYEEMTFNVIMRQMLNRIPSTFDKREGSIIYDALAPCAAELAQLYINLDVVLNQTFADTATQEYLEKRCAERGIIRTPATYAIVQGEFTPTDVDVLDERFSCGIYNYKVIGKTNIDGVYQLICETSGELPNAISGQLIPINYINGLETATITSLLIPGEDVEDDESLRERYFDSLSSQAFGGNIADYKEKTKMINGVGGVKVTPVWNGGGTVLLTITSSDYSVPSSTLIHNVQELIDPTQNNGEGKGIAPIGHVVTVKGVTTREINIATQITYQNGWGWEDSSSYIHDTIDDYFQLLSKEWEDVNNIVIRISAIEQRILACPGILDIQDTTLNGEAKNLQLDEHEIPVRGDISDGQTT